MTQIRAISAGAKMEIEHFTGTVHSVFARACNVALDDGRLLSLLASELGNAPSAVRLEMPPGFTFDAALKTGERVSCRAGVMRFGEAGVSVRLGTVVRWRHDLDGLAVDLARPRVFAAWRGVRRCLRRHEEPNGGARSGVPPSRALRLWRAARTADVEAGTAALQGLIGCGVGLTPAGDDVVVGFLAGLRAAMRGTKDRLTFWTAISAAIDALTSRTNLVSAAYLHNAAEGGFAEPLAVLASEIAHGAGEDEVLRAARSALAVGATSGGDGVRGLLLGLAAWGRLPVAEDAAGG